MRVSSFQGPKTGKDLLLKGRPVIAVSFPVLPGGGEGKPFLAK